MNPSPESAQPVEPKEQPAPSPSYGVRDRKVLQGSETIAVAKSGSMARRIMNALNHYKADKKGR